MSDNLSIWKEYAIPDEKACKKTKLGGGDSGLEITSISGAWFDRVATAKFGHCGIGWGWEIMEERYDNGETFLVWLDKEHQIYEKCVAKTHTLKVKLWYVLDGQRGEIIHYGHTPALYRSKWGATNDPEAPKKSLTDAKKKCLSALGFASAIFEGLFDDQDYAETVRFDQSLSKAEDKSERAIRIESQLSEIHDATAKNVELIMKAVSMSEIKGLMLYRKTLESYSTIPELNAKCIACIGALDGAQAKRVQQLKEQGK